MSTEDTAYRLLSRGMAGLLWAAGVLVALAGFQLFVLTENTERYFAWTVDPPLTAAFLGAAYWSSAVFEWTAARRRFWADARIAVPGVFVFTAQTLVVTLIHLDKFHLGAEFEMVTRAVTWLWLAIYLVVPLLMATLWIGQQRRSGVDPPPGAPLPAWVRGLLAVHAVVLGGVGLALLIAPTSAPSVWPWQLTPLTGRAIGAWLVSLAVVAVHTWLEKSAGRIRPAGWAYIAFAVLQGVALIRYPDAIAWSSGLGIGYLAFLASALVIGAGILARRSDATRAPS